MLKAMRGVAPTLVTVIVVLLGAAEAHAFCGFFVASAGADLYNETSQVVVVREGDRTAMNMEFNYKGSLNNFALVLPVPEVLKEGDVRIVRPDLFRKLDAYSAPRLVDYPAKDPCAKPKPRKSARKKSKSKSANTGAEEFTDEELGVTVEAQFDVEEYQIVILSAKESNGLETWLNQEGYTIPEGSAPYYTPYIERGMFFFVVRVNLDKLQDIALAVDKNGFQTLRPIQFEYRAENFMLPIQLGKINAVERQNLVLYLISPDGRYRVKNYKNIDIPTNLHVDESYKADPAAFQAFYKKLIETAAARAESEGVLTEYVWKISKCDPCPTQPPSAQELAELGAHVKVVRRVRGKRKGKPKIQSPLDFNNDLDSANNYYDYVVTRFRANYPKDGFAEDLEFEKDTSGSVRFQGRYIIQFPWEGETACLSPEQRLAAVRSFTVAPSTSEEKQALAEVKKDPAVWAEAWIDGGTLPKDERGEAPTAPSSPSPKGTAATAAAAVPASAPVVPASVTSAPPQEAGGATAVQETKASSGGGANAAVCSVGRLRVRTSPGWGVLGLIGFLMFRSRNRR